jgi:predicted small secreted protein
MRTQTCLKRLGLTGAVLALAVLVSSCGSNTVAGDPQVTGAGDPQVTGAGDPQVTGAPAATSTEPDASTDLLGFTAPLVGGSDLNAASFAGKPVAFWFWAPG